MDIEPGDVFARRPVISLVTSSERLRAHGAGDYSILDAQVRAAIAAGVDLVQFREPGLPDAVLVNLVRRAVELAQGSTTRILVNGRIDVALASSAHGVHLPADGVSADRARPYLPPGFLVGRSVHDLVEAQGVVAEGGVDYLTMGTLFPSASKPGGLACGPQAGLSALPPQNPKPSWPGPLWKGKTKRCLAPRGEWPDDWMMDFTENHWSTREGQNEKLPAVL